ncbi:MAG: ABC transporter ATP-binding protein [Anaerolineales bacterium]
MTVPIVVEGLGKRFRRYSEDHAWTLQETILRGFKRHKADDYFWALKDVSFQVPEGKMLGLIGRNGAGKSTLLRLIGGVGEPEMGRIATHGRIGALIDLGAGFHPDLTGRENVFINGVISGLLRKEVDQRFDDIVQFSELEEFIDSPLRTYSTGMRMRLAFSVAVNIDPDILLIDEVLAVGDSAFQHKCLERIDEFKVKGCTIVLVSHDANLVDRICDEALWLNEGQIAARGPAEKVVMQYATAMQKETQKRTPVNQTSKKPDDGTGLKINENRFGSQEMEIRNVQLLNGAGDPVEHIESGESLTIEMEFHAAQAIASPNFGVTITREDGTICCDTNMPASDLGLPVINGRGKTRLRFTRLDLAKGTYFVNVGVYQKDWTYAYDYHWQVYSLRIGDGGPEKSLLYPPQQWEIETDNNLD